MSCGIPQSGSAAAVLLLLRAMAEELLAVESLDSEGIRAIIAANLN